MTSLITGHEKEYLKRRHEKVWSEYLKLRINIKELDHVPSSEELEKINAFNLQILRELEGG